MVLVPVGHVNELHEPPTFLGARRPDVERVVLPTTWRELGTGIFGDWGDFSYRAYLTSSLEGAKFSASSGLRGGRQDGSKAIAEDLGLTGRLDYSGVPGLVVGVSTFHGGSGQGEEVNGSEVSGNVTTFDLHADFEWRGLELRGLWAGVNVSDAEDLSVLTGETIGSRMEGWYLSAGYDVFNGTSIDGHRLIPFVRYEEYDTQDAVAPSLLPTVTGENDREQITYGISYLPIPNIAVKVDYQDIDNAAGSGVDQFNVGVGFFF